MKAEDYISDGTPRVAVDFDGVVYPGGQFQAAHVMDLAPIPGAIEWIKSLLDDGFEVLIFTARFCKERHVYFDNNEKDHDLMIAEFHQYFMRHGLSEKDAKKIVMYPPELGKPSCWLFVDDHGFRFDGYYPPPKLIRAMHENMYYKNARKKKLSSDKQPDAALPTYNFFEEKPGSMEGLMAALYGLYDVVGKVAINTEAENQEYKVDWVTKRPTDTGAQQLVQKRIDDGWVLVSVTSAGREGLYYHYTRKKRE